MLLTSGQVSLAISSTIVCIFTSALFLCGYVVQQKTVNEIREAIKPQPRPVHTNLYVPPKPSPTSPLGSNGDEGAQVVEIIHDGQGDGGSEREASTEVTPEQTSEEDDGDRLVQGADGGFLRTKNQRQRKQKILKDDNKSTNSRDKSQKESNRDGASNPRKLSEASGNTNSEPRERLSRAARRKLIQEEIRNLAGEDALNNPNAYKKRRLW